MADDFLSSLAELGVHVGMKLMGHAMEPHYQLDEAKLMDAILSVAGQTAAEIAEDLGIGQHINNVQFYRIASFIGRELRSLAEALAETSLDVKNRTIDLGETWDHEFEQLRRRTAHG